VSAGAGSPSSVQPGEAGGTAAAPNGGAMGASVCRWLPIAHRRLTATFVSSGLMMHTYLSLNKSLGSSIAPAAGMGVAPNVGRPRSSNLRLPGSGASPAWSQRDAEHPSTYVASHPAELCYLPASSADTWESQSPGSAVARAQDSLPKPARVSTRRGSIRERGGTPSSAPAPSYHRTFLSRATEVPLGILQGLYHSWIQDDG
jgi:hypothetical protein